MRRIDRAVQQPIVWTDDVTSRHDTTAKNIAYMHGARRDEKLKQEMPAAAYDVVFLAILTLPVWLNLKPLSHDAVGLMEHVHDTAGWSTG